MPPASGPLPPTRLSSRRDRGFSLVELLTVLTIIGILLGVAVPAVTGLGEDAHEARDRRNAQQIANVFVTGEAAGIDFLVPGDLDTTIANIVAGSVVHGGVFDGQKFAVPGLNPEERAQAARYLRLQESRIVYDADA